MRIRIRPAALAAVALALLSAAALVPGGPRPAARWPPAAHPMIPAVPGTVLLVGPGGGAVRTVRSLNWAGYAVARRAARFSAVSATFFVPYLDCHSFPGAPVSYSAHWVGLDGFSSGTVEQDGISADCRGGRPSYAAWYEVYPRPEVPVSLVFYPGNSITASVRFGARTRTFTMALTDNSNGHRFTVTRRCASSSCARDSAEVISEAPLVGGQEAKLAAYQAASFGGIGIRDSAGRAGGIVARYWTAVRIIQAQRTGMLAVPTRLSDGGFVNYWLAPAS